MRAVAELPDPLGRVCTGRTLDSGVRMEQVTVPLGVVAMIYEARPNVTADAFALCLAPATPSCCAAARRRTTPAGRSPTRAAPASWRPACRATACSS